MSLIISMYDQHVMNLGLFVQDLDPNPPREEFAIALSVITYVGLGISLVCLAVFILTDLISK